MIQFPTVIEVEADGKMAKFFIREISHNVFAIKHHLHTMQNADDLTFGYIIYHDGYLYASCTTPDETHPDKLVFACYIGPEELTMSNEKASHLFESIAIAVVQLSIFENKHPAIFDRDSFNEIFETLMVGIQSKVLEPNTPFIQPIYEMAIELRDFYASMISRIEALAPQEKTDDTIT